MKTLGFAALALVVLTLSPALAAADSTFTDANWSSMGGFPGANEQVFAAVVDGVGNLYIGGNFNIVGDVIANGIAKWDGTNWSALGSGIGSAWALAASGNDVQAATVGSGEPATIAKWDGKQWSVLGSATNESNGVFNFVNALVVSGGNLYAGGEFTTVGGISATNIAKWNGGSWSALSAGLSGNIPGYAPVTALAVSGSDVYAGGSFTNAGGIAVESIAKWNGSSWSALGSGEHPKVVYALAVSGNHLYAGGRFGTIAKWNGSTWSELGSGMEGWGVSALAVSGDDVYAGGNFTTAGGLTANSIARQNGSNWTPLGSGVDGSVAALVVSGSDLYVSGDFMTAGGKVSPFIARAYLPELPGLSVLRSGSDIKISWPSADTATFSLEQAGTLGTLPSWLPSTAPVTDDGVRKSVTVPVSNSAQLFRLRRQ